MLTIDGSQHSGSGTIVRDAVALAALTGRSVRVTHIRARRKPPGLRAQHMTVIRAIATLCQGRLQGDAVGSREIYFVPGGPIRGGHYTFDIGTAGSTTMLASALLPVLLMASHPSTVTIRGGVFQDFAPSAFHFQHVLLPLIQQMGVQATLEIIQPGYVPTGGGHIRLSVTPLSHPLRPLLLTEQGRIHTVEGIALASHLKQRRVADRMARSCERHLQAQGFPVNIQRLEDERHHPAFEAPAPQPGAALAIWAPTGTGGLLGADMAGKPGRSSEFIGEHVARQFLEDVASGAAVDRHLADQWIPFAALADGESRVRIPAITDHVAARLWLIQLFLGVTTRVEGTVVSISGKGIAPAQG